MRECKLQSFAHLPNFAKDEMKNNFGVIFPMMLIGIQQKLLKNLIYYPFRFWEKAMVRSVQ